VGGSFFGSFGGAGGGSEGVLFAAASFFRDNAGPHQGGRGRGPPGPGAGGGPMGGPRFFFSRGRPARGAAHTPARGFREAKPGNRGAFQPGGKGGKGAAGTAPREGVLFGPGWRPGARPGPWQPAPSGKRGADGGPARARVRSEIGRGQVSGGGGGRPIGPPPSVWNRGPRQGEPWGTAVRPGLAGRGRRGEGGFFVGRELGNRPFGRVGGGWGGAGSSGPPGSRPISGVNRRGRTGGRGRVPGQGGGQTGAGGGGGGPWHEGRTRPGRAVPALGAPPRKRGRAKGGGGRGKREAGQPRPGLASPQAERGGKKKAVSGPGPRENGAGEIDPRGGLRRGPRRTRKPDRVVASFFSLGGGGGRHRRRWLGRRGAAGEREGGEGGRGRRREGGREGTRACRPPPRFVSEGARPGRGVRGFFPIGPKGGGGGRVFEGHRGRALGGLVRGAGAPGQFGPGQNPSVSNFERGFAPGGRGRAYFVRSRPGPLGPSGGGVSGSRPGGGTGTTGRSYRARGVLRASMGAGRGTGPPGAAARGGGGPGKGPLALPRRPSRDSAGGGGGVSPRAGAGSPRPRADSYDRPSGPQFRFFLSPGPRGRRPLAQPRGGGGRGAG